MVVVIVVIFVSCFVSLLVPFLSINRSSASFDIQGEYEEAGIMLVEAPAHRSACSLGNYY